MTLSHETSYVKTTASRTDKTGTVLFPVLRPGRGYAIRIASPGLSSLRYDELRVKIGETLTLVVQMFADVSETVKVTADRGVIDLDKTELLPPESQHRMAQRVPGVDVVEMDSCHQVMLQQPRELAEILLEYA